MIEQERTSSVKNLFRVGSVLAALFVATLGFTAHAFADSGVEEVSETEISESDVPSAVEDAFEETDYADWPIVEREKIQSKHHGTVYEIEVEKDEELYGLYFKADGEHIDTEEEHHGTEEEHHRTEEEHHEEEQDEDHEEHEEY